MTFASGPTIITIATTDEGVSYAMRDSNYRVQHTFNKVEELEAWMRKGYPQETQKVEKAFGSALTIGHRSRLSSI